MTGKAQDRGKCVDPETILYFFFRKNGKSFAVDFIRRYKEKKKGQIQLSIYTQRPLLNKTEN